MDRHQFRALAAERPLLLDGATGTELMKRGLPPGAPPEQWVLDNPDVIRTLHGEYFDAGSDIVLACTFGLNRIKLANHKQEDRCGDMNRRLVELSRAVTPAGKMLFGDMSSTGMLVEPFGDFPFEEAVAVYREQAKALADAGVDGFIIETMIDIQETRAALLAVRDVAPNLAVIAGMTYEANGRTVGGTPPEAAVATLQALGADAVGCNCSTGPDEMLVLLERMLPYARVPVFIKPNAGMPCLRDGRNHYDLEPAPFAEAVLRGVAMGARIVGGCCGTTPEHIRATKALLAEHAGTLRPPPPSTRLALTSSRALVDFSPVEGRAAPLRVIGERINPTGKKAFQAELLAGGMDRILAFAEEQTAAGADCLDVNLGLGGIDEAAMLRAAVAMLTPATEAPLVIDTVNADAMERALRLYPGRALVNSVSAEAGRIAGILPIAAKYGAAIIVLPVEDGRIPATARERMEAVRNILRHAEAAGLTRHDALVDGLAMTVSADPAAGRETLETIRMCAAEGLSSLLGLSNVSFGMPERQWLNAMFLAMGMGNGLAAVIANPSAPLLMEAKLSADALLNRAGGTENYIARFAAVAREKREQPKTPPSAPSGKAGAPAPGSAAPAAAPATPEEQASRAILKGGVRQAAGLARKAIEAGAPADALVADHLVPAIMKAGELFEKGEYYLPQLMLAGEAMRLALAELEPDLAKTRGAGAGPPRGKILVATVEGDVHDIGKNLVTLMLRNHGFEVIDLGKDVSPAAIVAAMKEHRPDIVGLSALMTTTLAAMQRTIAAVRDAGYGAAKFMVGGAAVTEHFAKEAGADGYSPDAVSAVRLAADLIGERR